MKINGVGVNKIINLYKNKNTSVEKNSVNRDKDRVEISSLGKKLSSLSVDGELMSSKEKIEAIKSELSKGTYKPNSNLIAKSIIDNIKGKGV